MDAAVTLSMAVVCGPRGGSGRIVMIRCDADGCSAQVSYTNREEYVAAGNAGWRRDRLEQHPDAKHRCPQHAHEFGVLAVASG